MNILSSVSSPTPHTAMWGPYLLLPPGRANRASAGIWDGKLNFTSEREAGQQEAVEAQNPLEPKEGDKQKQFSLAVQVNKYATGQDPVDVHHAWMLSLGKSHWFFVGALPISSSRFMLEAVEFHFSNRDLAADGSVYRADLHLSFIENTLLRSSRAGADDEGGSASAGPGKAAKKEEAFSSSLFSSAFRAASPPYLS